MEWPHGSGVVNFHRADTTSKVGCRSRFKAYFQTLHIFLLLLFGPETVITPFIWRISQVLNNHLRYFHCSYPYLLRAWILDKSTITDFFWFLTIKNPDHKNILHAVLNPKSTKLMLLIYRYKNKTKK